MPWRSRTQLGIGNAVSVPRIAVAEELAAGGGGLVLPEGAGHAFGHGASIRAINPGRFLNNCPECSIYVDDLLAGRGLRAATDSPMITLNQMERLVGGEFSAQMGSLSEIEAAMVEAGPGARGIVFAHQGDIANGHYFNAVNQNGVVRLLDGQSGTGANVGLFKEFSLMRTH